MCLCESIGHIYGKTIISLKSVVHVSCLIRAVTHFEFSEFLPLSMVLPLHSA
jgi:hypothetical protein